MSVLTQKLPTDTHPAPATGTTDLVDEEPPSTMRCPDPSAHQTKDTTLQDQASAAAFSKPASQQEANTHSLDPLRPDGKLSSASAATSLKYARAQDLPGFPVIGIDNRQSAGTAANLAHANQKTPEWWKPEQSSSAGKAAILAHHLKMEPVWRPEASETGSQAALLAHKGGAKSNLWAPAASAEGNSAASIAMKKQSPPSASNNAAKELGRKSSLAAATGAASSARRRRALSTPVAAAPYTDSGNRSNHALSAATLAHTPSMRSRVSPTIVDSNRLGSTAMEAARIQHSKVTREMYTEHPPVALEVEEKNHQNALRASALSMAKQMYDTQQKHHDKAAGRSVTAQGRSAATTAHEKKHHSSEADIKEQAKRYLHVQEAAQKLAAERLAKLDANENDGFRSYYGYASPTKSRFRLSRRGRASSNPEPVDSDDELQSNRIRSQMSQLNRTLAQVDAKKEQDRRNLMAAAERKVQAQMLGMDQKIFNETGKMSPAMIEEWDAKARAKAAENSDTRMAHHGKVDIGGGRFIDQSEIDAVAAARVQPTLDEIAEKIEKQKAKEEEMRLDREEEKRQAQIAKERAAEIKAEEKRAKDEEKKTKSRFALKQGKEAEKAKKAEEKRLQCEERHKPKEADRADITYETIEPIISPPIQPSTEPAQNLDEQDDELYRSPEPIQQTVSQAPAGESTLASSPSATPPKSPTSPTSPTSPARSGFKTFLHKFRRRSRHSAGAAEEEQPGFIARLSRRGSSPSQQGSQPQSPEPDANTFPTPRTDQNTYSDVSSMSSVHSVPEVRSRQAARTTTDMSNKTGNTEFEEARDGFDEQLAPSPNFTTTTDVNAARIGSPTRESRFREVGL